MSKIIVIDTSIIVSALISKQDANCEVLRSCLQGYCNEQYKKPFWSLINI